MKKIVFLLLVVLLVMGMAACSVEDVLPAEVPEADIRADVQECLAEFVDSEALIVSLAYTQESVGTERQVICEVEHTNGSITLSMRYEQEKTAWTLCGTEIIQNDGTAEHEELPEEDALVNTEQENTPVEDDAEAKDSAIMKYLMDGIWYLYDETGDLCYECIFRSDNMVDVYPRYVSGEYTMERRCFPYRINEENSTVWIDGTYWSVYIGSDTLSRIGQDPGAEMVDESYMQHYDEVPSAEELEQAIEIYRLTRLEQERMKGQNGYCLYENDAIGLLCYYPDGFTVSTAMDEECLRSYVNDETGEKINFCYTQMSTPVTGKELLDWFYSFNPDMEVTYSDSGDSWYAVSAKVDNGYYYRKAILRNNTEIAWFEYFTPKMETPGENATIEYMEEHFAFK